MADSSSSAKDTVYIDIDDEITSIIDKVRSSKHKIVALVLPKRATVLQSIVNMKLLKRTSDETKKRIVLITSEVSLLPLAGAVKLHVAKTLQSKPAIPLAPSVPSSDMAVDESDQLDDTPDPEPDLDKTKPVGELAGDEHDEPGAMAAKPEPEETIELDNDALSDDADPKNAKAKRAGKKLDKKLKVPNFNKFRTRIFLIGGGFVLLIILWYLAYFVMPKATITVKTDNLTSNVDITFTAATSIKSFDAAAKNVPATSKETKKSDNVKVSATGKKNVGEKAKGTVKMSTVVSCGSPVSDVPAGVTVSSNGLNFITQDGGIFGVTGLSGGKCVWTTGNIAVVADNSGDQYNLSDRDYSVGGYANVSAHGSAMAGGTTKNVTTVSDQDIETAKQQLNDKSKGVAQTELSKQLQDAGLSAIEETLVGNSPTVTSSPKVGEEGNDVTVTTETTYTMLGVKNDDLKALVVDAAKKDIDTNKQKINDDGLSKAVYRLVDKKSVTEQKLSLQSTVSTGVSVNENELKKQVAGKKRGDVQSQIGALPGVKDVTVTYSPFWVYTTPKKTSHINFVFQKL